MTLQFLVSEWTQLEMAIGAVNRTRSFVSKTVGEVFPGETRELPKDWPSQGSIIFNQVSVSYSSAAELVLKDVNLTIQAGKKVAICGRTGSGKSSMSLSVLRMVEIFKGSIVIDGVDISTIPREEIRKRLNAIPQDPCFLPGSLRENIDQLKCAQDARIISVLTRLGLWEVLQGSGGLDQILNLDMLSHGQRQLLCLTRAVLRHGQIILMDEVTSNMDAETERVVQSVICEEFANRTLLAIAHRLDTVLEFDQVVVLDNGHVVESGEPMDLLSREGSWFKGIYEASTTST